MTSASTSSRSHSAFSAYQRGQHQIAARSPQLTPHPEPSKELQDQLYNFWMKQYEEVEGNIDFKSHCLPLARIKKIMKSNEDVKMISADASVLFSKACEMFIKELSLRSWFHAEENRRRTLHRSDIATAVSHNEVFDFLVDTVPRDNTMEHDIYSGIQGGRTNIARNIEIAPNLNPNPNPNPNMASSRNVVGPHYGLPRMITGNRVPNQPRFGTLITHPPAFRVPPPPKPHQQKDAPDSDEN
ncbi:hypothetical protein VNO77_27652 [Canavalia gladiata]|uniref:Transcription factor CBF/NF-Y/archaeal histone domain-containing protein n=1 Tax=Canavalia gladiata TaxID=3824 RepID=A0AAN9KUI4_CANGL